MTMPPQPSMAIRLRETNGGTDGSYLFGARLEAIFTTCVWSSVSHASTPRTSASERPSLTASSCVGDIACGALGITLIWCSRTAVGCETRRSHGFTFDALHERETRGIRLPQLHRRRHPRDLPLFHPIAPAVATFSRA